MPYAIQGIASKFGEIFRHTNDELWLLKSGCLDSSIDSGAEIHLLMNHEGKSLGTTRDDLEVYAGEQSLAFRFSFPDSLDCSELSEVAGVIEHYFPVSIGFKTTALDKVTIQGEQIFYVQAADIHEISILEREPAIKATYCRVVDLAKCGTLQDDYESGMFDLTGRVIGLHRKALALDNDGVIDYKHSISETDKKANAFLNALQRLTS
jgi:phage head maturation protease